MVRPPGEARGAGSGSARSGACSFLLTAEDKKNHGVSVMEVPLPKRTALLAAGSTSKHAERLQEVMRVREAGLSRMALLDGSFGSHLGGTQGVGEVLAKVLERRLPRRKVA